MIPKEDPRTTNAITNPINMSGHMELKYTTSRPATITLAFDITSLREQIQADLTFKSVFLCLMMRSKDTTFAIRAMTPITDTIYPIGKSG